MIKQLEGMTRMVGIGDTITAKNVHGEIISGEIKKIYANSVLVLSQTTPQLVCKKEIYQMGDSIEEISDPIIGKTEFTISKYRSA